MSDAKTSPNKALYILIAVLLVISLVQTAFLIQQHIRQTRIEQQQALKYAPLSDRSFLSAKLRPTPQPTTQYHQNPYFQNSFSSDPWEQFDTISQRMNDMMRHALMFGSPLIQNMSRGEGFDYMPALDIQKTQDAYIVKSDLPGLQKDKINLTVQNNILTIEGTRETSSEKQDEKSGFFAQERSYGSFARSVPLPGPVDETKINAQYKDGVLVITLPKIQDSSTGKKVAVQ